MFVLVYNLRETVECCEVFEYGHVDMYKLQTVNGSYEERYIYIRIGRNVVVVVVKRKLWLMYGTNAEQSGPFELGTHPTADSPINWR
jgi:hypothetical protein